MQRDSSTLEAPALSFQSNVSYVLEENRFERFNVDITSLVRVVDLESLSKY